MEEGKTINVVHIWFNDIVVGFKGFGKVIEKWSLPKKWRPKVTAIEEIKDLATMTMKEFLGSPITHEHTL